MFVKDKTAVDRDQLAGDKARKIAQQPDHAAGDIFRLLRAAERAAVLIQLMTLGGNVFRGLNAGQSRRDGVDTDPLFTQLAGHGAGHRNHRALTGDIGHQPRRAPQRGIRSDVDDRRPFAQQRYRRAGHQPGAFNVDRHYPIPQIRIVIDHIFSADAGGHRCVID